MQSTISITAEIYVRIRGVLSAEIAGGVFADAGDAVAPMCREGESARIICTAATGAQQSRAMIRIAVTIPHIDNGGVNLVADTARAEQLAGLYDAIVDAIEADGVYNIDHDAEVAPSMQQGGDGFSVLNFAFVVLSDNRK